MSCVVAFASLAVSAAAIEVTGISPSVRWDPQPPVNVTITGDGFAVGSTPKLAKTGRPDIAAVNVVVESPTTITATFALDSAAPGAWDLVVRHNVLGQAVLEKAFILRPEPPLEALGSFGGPVQAMDLIGNLAYVIRGSTLAILDVTDPADMVELGAVELATNPLYGVAVAGDFAFVTGSTPIALSVIDVSDSSNPTLLVSGLTLGDGKNPPYGPITIRGNIGYVMAEPIGSLDDLLVFDLSDPGNPTNVISGVRVFTLAGEFLYTVAQDGGNGEPRLDVYDIVADPLSPVLLGTAPLALPWWADIPRAVAAEGGLAVVASRDGTVPNGERGLLTVVDVSDPAAPMVTGAFAQFTDNPTDVALAGDLAYVATFAVGSDPHQGVVVVDVGSDPSSPSLVTGFNLTNHDRLRGLSLAGTILYLRDEAEGLVSVDVTDVLNPVRLDRYYSPARPGEMAKEGDVLYVVDLWNGVAALDVSDPHRPAVLGVHETAASPGDAQIAVRDGFVYVPASSAGLEVVDFSDAANPVLSTTIPLAQAGGGLAVEGDLLVVGQSSSGAQVFNISSPAFPVAVSTFPFSGVTRVDVSPGSVAYCVGSGNNLEVWDLSDPADPVQVDVAPGDYSDVVVDGDLLYGLNAGSSGSLRIFTILEDGGLADDYASLSMAFVEDVAVRHGFGYTHAKIPANADSAVALLRMFDAVDITGSSALIADTATGRHESFLAAGPYLYAGGGGGPGPSLVIYEIGTPGDYNGDQAVTEADRDAFVACFTGSGGSAAGDCVVFDTDGDGDVDCADWRTFVHGYLLANGSPPDAALEVGAFVAALLAAPPDGAAACLADADGDGAVNGDDIQPFVDHLLAGSDDDPVCPGAGDCCTAHGGAGCDAAPCCTSVCSADPFCCASAWDGLCATEAADNPNCPCGAGPVCGDPSTGGACCQDNDTPGCRFPGCCAAVCALDPYCCQVQWDGLCAQAAANDTSCPCGLPESFCSPATTLNERDLEPDCGLVDGVFNDTVNGGCNVSPPLFLPVSCGEQICGSGLKLVGGGRDTDWYELVVTETTAVTLTIEANFVGSVGFIWTVPPGSGDCADATGLLRPYKPFGFEHPWVGPVTLCATPGTYWLFVGAVVGEPDQSCETNFYNLSVSCAPDDSCFAGGDCCSENGTPGCEDSVCQASVCAMDSFCCSGSGGWWDNVCADQAAVDPLCPCGADQTCGDPAAGSCCADNGTPTCAQQTCCDAVCAYDDFCCAVAWDAICAEEALAEPACDCDRDPSSLDPPPVIDSVLFNPASADNCHDAAPVAAQIMGSGFEPGAAAALVLEGQNVINGFDVQVIDDTLMTAMFNVQDAPLGSYVLEVRNPNSEPAVSAETLPVTACPTGACCAPGGCVERTEFQCSAIGGAIYEGDNTTCEPKACAFGRYHNISESPIVFYAPAGGGLQLGDNMTLAGAFRDLVSLELGVLGPFGEFDVTVTLYDACPGAGGVPIPGTTFTWTDIPDGPPQLLSAEFGTPVTIPGTVWMVAQFSHPNVGWVIAREAEIGFTGDFIADLGPPWDCNAGFPCCYAGLWAGLECVDGGLLAGGEEHETRLRIVPLEPTEPPVAVESVPIPSALNPDFSSTGIGRAER